MPAPLRTTHSKAEAKYNVTTEFPSLGLHAAAASGNLGLVEFALHHGQPVNSVLDGVLPLHAASAGGNAQVVRVLIEHGADVNAPRLPRRYSNDKNRDASTPIVGTSGSTPLHFAAANGNLNVITTLLLHGAHADRPDKHGVTPEMLARQNGWLECAQVLHDWALNKDKDLREREALSYYTHAEQEPHPLYRKRIQVKRSIDTAFTHMFKPSASVLSEAYLKPVQVTSSSLAINPKISTSIPPISPFPPLGDSSHLALPSNDGPNIPFSSLDLTHHRPSLCQANQLFTINSARNRKTSAPTEPPAATHRPRSASNDADQEIEQQDPPTWGRKRLGTKYSLLSLFKKAQTTDPASTSSEAFDSTNPNNIDALGTSSISILSPNSSPSPQPLGSVHTTPLSSSPQPHVNLSTPAVDSDEKPSQAILPPSTSVSPLSRGPFSFHRDAHLRSQRDRSRSASSGRQLLGVGRESEAPRARHSPSNGTSPLSRLKILRSRGHRRDRSGSGSSLDAVVAQAHPSGYKARASLDESTRARNSLELSPSPTSGVRPGILRPHHRTSSSSSTHITQSQATPPGVRYLRFDESSSSGFATKKDNGESFARSDILLRPSNSMGSFVGPKMELGVNGHSQNEPESAPPILYSFCVSESSSAHNRVEDDDVDYGQPVVLPHFGSMTTDARSALMSTQIPLVASSSKASLSPIEEPASGDLNGANALTSQFPFNDQQQQHLAEPARDRGDSLSSTTTNNSQACYIGSTSTGGGSLTATTPAHSPLQDLHWKEQDLVTPKPRTPSQSEELSISSNLLHITTSIGERRSHIPLDIDLRTISSHAQAEALVQRAQQEILEMDLNELTTGAGRTPLSARLAAYGETLALERKLREKEQREREEAARREDQMKEWERIAAAALVQRRPSVESNLSRRASRVIALHLAKDGVIPEIPPTDDEEDVNLLSIDRSQSLGHSQSMTKTRRKASDEKRPSTAEGLSRQTNTSGGSDHTPPSTRSAASGYVPTHRSRLSIEHDMSSPTVEYSPPVVRAQSSLGTHTIRSQYSSSYLPQHRRHSVQREFALDLDHDDPQSVYGGLEDEFGHSPSRPSTSLGIISETSFGIRHKKALSGLSTTLAAPNDKDKRSAKKLTKMGFTPPADLSAKGRMPTSLPLNVSVVGHSGSSGGRFGVIKSFFKGTKDQLRTA